MTEITEDYKKEPDPFMEYFNGDYERFVKDEELRNKNFDFELIEKIVVLAKSEDVQDRLHSLDLIEDSSKKFPLGFVANLLIALEQDSEEKIRTKVEITKKKRKIETAEKFRESIGNLSDTYSKMFRNISSGIDTASNAFSQSQGIARNLSLLIDQPIKLIDPKMFEGYIKTLAGIPSFTAQMGIGDAVLPITSIANQLEDTFSPITSIANQLEDTFSPITSIANQLEDTFSPITSITNQLEDTLSPITSIANQMSLVEIASPISAINQIISPVLTQDYPDLTISEALGKTSAEIRNDLEMISKADTEIIFNYKAYPLLFNLERFLRDLINQRICIKHKSNIKSKIHGNVIEGWKVRKSREEQNSLMKERYRLIEYSDFSDLQQIFIKGNNKMEFFDLCNEREFMNIVTKLDELDPIRKKIAHSRSLSKSEFDRLQMYADDIKKLLNPMKDAK